MQDLSLYTLRHIVERASRLFKDAPAYSAVGGTPLTFGEVCEHVTKLSLWLEEEGIGRGDRVAILSESCVHWGIVYFAITSMGAVAVPILPDFHPDAIQHILRHSEAKAIFVSEKLYSKLEECKDIEDILGVSMESFMPIEYGTTRAKVRDLKAMGLREFRKLREKAVRMKASALGQNEEHNGLDIGAPYEPQEEDTAVIIYTSGTTGHSKGVMLSHKNIVWDAHAVRALIQLHVGDRMLSILPLAHTYECTLGLILPMINGVHVHYLEKPPTARALLPAFAAVRPTAMLSVPLVIEKMYKTSLLPKLTGSWLKKKLYAVPMVRRKLNAIAGRKLLEIFGGELKIFCIGGAGLAPDVEQFLREAKFPYAIGYGLTETAPLIAGSGPEATRFTSTGYTMPDTKIRIVDADPKTGNGEIVVKGPSVMQGYYKAPQVSKEAFTLDGWFRTGDLGRFDKDGYLYIKGRLKNVIIGPSGENIYPEEIEALIHQSPYVLESLVLQVDGKLVARIHLDSTRMDEEFGNLTAAEAAAQTKALLETLRLEVNSKVSAFAKISKVVNQQEPFEKTPTHKIKRFLYV
ncbi:MAG: AMP-binding protein [Pseudomonadota bacterium]